MTCIYKDCNAAEAAFSVFCAQHWAERKWKFKADFETVSFPQMSNEVDKWIAKTSWGVFPPRKPQPLSALEAEKLSVARYFARKKAKAGNAKAKEFLVKTEKVAAETVDFQDIQVLDQHRVGQLFPGARALDFAKQQLMGTALGRAAAMADEFIQTLEGHAGSQAVATAWLEGAFGNKQTSKDHARRVLGLMHEVLLYWEQNVGEQRNVAENVLYTRFNWQGATKTDTETEDQLNLDLPLKPRNPLLPPSEPHVCFRSDKLDRAVTGTDAQKLDLCHTLLHECVHGVSKEYSIDHAYQSSNPEKFKTLSEGDRLKNPDHNKVMICEWLKDKVTVPTALALQNLFGDPADWGGAHGGGGGATDRLAKIIGDVKQVLNCAMIESQNAFKRVVEGAPTGNFTVGQVGEWKRISDEAQRLYILAAKVVSEVDASRTSGFFAGADNVEIVWRQRQNANEKRWFAVFPSDYAKKEDKVLRGWFLRSLLKSAAVQVGSGVTFEKIREVEKSYYETRGVRGSPTEIE
jgi:hypothetical protein